jgi:hypothetical protein
MKNHKKLRRIQNRYRSPGQVGAQMSYLFWICENFSHSFFSGILNSIRSYDQHLDRRLFKSKRLNRCKSFSRSISMSFAWDRPWRRQWIAPDYPEPSLNSILIYIFNFFKRIFLK